VLKDVWITPAESYPPDLVPALVMERAQGNDVPCVVTTTGTPGLDVVGFGAAFYPASQARQLSNCFDE
jgi:hypothetical protein